MKTKRQSYCGGWKQALGVLLVFALAAGLALGVPAPGGAYAAPVLLAEGDENDTGNNTGSGTGDNAGGTQQPAPGAGTGAGALNLTSTACSVTVGLPETMSGQPLSDLNPVDTAADLYLIAPAVPLSGYDAYAYCIDSGMPYYSAVKAYLEGIPNWHLQPLTAAPDGYSRPEDLPAMPTEPQEREWLVFRYAPADPEHAKAGEQEGLAELLAKLLFAPGQPDASGQAAAPMAESFTPARTGKDGIKEPIGGLSAGLYLNVVHGRELPLEDYAVLVESKDEKDQNGAPLQKVCTVAYSDTKVYTFQPQLLSLPGRTDAAGNQTMDTAAAGAWAYGITVTAKGEAAPRYADLEISKTLTGYGAPVTFVFHVAAYAPNPNDTNSADPIYEKVVPLTFTGAGTQTAQLITNKIPAGSTVVITEEYGGAGYRFEAATATLTPNPERPEGQLPAITPAIDATAHSVTITNIPAGGVHLTAPAGEEKILEDGVTAVVTFTNGHDDTNNGGGAVINSFAPGADGGWTWTKRTYNAETGQWVAAEPEPVAPAGEG